MLRQHNLTQKNGIKLFKIIAVRIILHNQNLQFLLFHIDLENGQTLCDVKEIWNIKPDAKYDTV